MVLLQILILKKKNIILILIIRHCKHYSGRGLMKKYNNGAELAADMV